MQVRLPLCLLFALPAPALAQGVIDFENVPGIVMKETAKIFDEYRDLHGVSFRMINENNGNEVSKPSLVEIGAPLRAFSGVSDIAGTCADGPAANTNVGQWFLTDKPGAGLPSNWALRITYDTPVAAASGVILDVDERVGPMTDYEEWTIEAYDGGDILSDTIVDTFVLRAPQCPNPGTNDCDLSGTCDNGQGAGDGGAAPWSVQAESAVIETIVIRYTGTKPRSNVGLAFDNFSPTSTALCGGFAKYGFACASSEGPPPSIRGAGCPAPFQEFQVVVEEGPAGAHGCLLISASPANYIFESCNLLVEFQPLELVVPHVLAGDGSFSASFVLPPEAVGAEVFMQAGYCDPIAGLAMTQGLVVQPGVQ